MAPRSINNALYAGKMDVTIYPYQDVASIDADQLLLDIVKPGVFNAHVTTAVNGTSIDFIIHAGTMIIFKKSFTETSPSYTRDFIVKIIVVEDITITETKANLNGLDEDGLVIICGWDWEQTFTSGTSKYATFVLKGIADPAVWTGYLIEGDLIVCELLNHRAVIDASSSFDINGDGTFNYQIAYQNIYARQTNASKVIKDYRNTFEQLNNSANQFNIQFGDLAEEVPPASGDYYTKIYCVSGYGMIRDTAFSIDEKTDGIPIPIETVPAEKLGSGNDWQIDILRIIISDDISNTPELEWTSVTSSTSPGTLDRDTPLTIKQALAVLGTQEIPFVDDGIIVGIAVRFRTTIGIHTIGSPNVLWPYQFVKWNSGIPFTGHVPSSTRMSIPIYTESDIVY
jgi:hypothetical protein